MKRFTILAVSAWLIILAWQLVGAQVGGSRIFQLFDSANLPSTITRLTGKVDTVHATTGGYTRGLVQSLSLVGGDSLWFAVLVDSSTTTVATAGKVPRVILEARAAYDSLSEGANNNYGYYNKFNNNPWTRASFDTIGKVERGLGIQDTLWVGAFPLKNINKTGQVEYRFRSLIADSGESTSRIINLRWKIYAGRPW